MRVGRTFAWMMVLTVPVVYAKLRLSHVTAIEQWTPELDSQRRAQQSAHSMFGDHFMTRLIDRMLPVSIQHKLRDAGVMSKSDTFVVTVAAVHLMLTRPLWTWRKWTHLKADEGRGVHRDIPYGPHSSHQLDIYNSHCLANQMNNQSIDQTSDTPVNHLSPVVLFTHGGAWGSGNKFMYSLFGRTIDQSCGAVCVVHGYRVWPHADAINQSDDLKRTIAWTKSNIARFGGDPSRIILMGHSSGAHISSLTLVNEPSSGNQSNNQSSNLSGVVGFVGLSGVYNIADHFIFESLRGVEQISPMKVANRNEIQFDDHSPEVQLRTNQSNVPTLLTTLPTLLLHGDHDETVPFNQSIKLSQARGGFVIQTSDQFSEYLNNKSINQNNQCVCAIVPSLDHAAPVTELMFEQTGLCLPFIRRFIDMCRTTPIQQSTISIHSSAEMAATQHTSRL